MIKIIDINNKEYNIKCIACAIQGDKIKLPLERVLETEHFVVEQDLEWPIEGFLIIASKRHIHSILDFNEEEEKDFWQVLKNTRKVMKDIAGIEDVTIIQEENSANSHFHIWLFPWHKWMMEYGTKLDKIKFLMEYAKEHFLKDEAYMEKLKDTNVKLKAYFK